MTAGALVPQPDDGRGLVRSGTTPAALANLLLPPKATREVEEWRPIIGDLLWIFTLAWLGESDSPHTRDAYRRDIAVWFGWVARHGVDPVLGRPTTAAEYIKHLNNERVTPCGEPEAPRTRRRRIAAVSSWYRFLRREDMVGQNPFDAAKRPARPSQSPTGWLSAREVDRLLEETGKRSTRDQAIVYCLYLAGLRVGSLCAADVPDYRELAGYQVLRLTVKGGDEVFVPLMPPAAAAVEAHLAERVSAGQFDPLASADLPTPLIATSTGGRMTRGEVTDLLRRIARDAEIKEWAKITPHWLRKTAITELLAAGTPLHLVQDFALHRSPETTQLYNAQQGLLATNPAPRLLAAHAGVFSHAA